MIKFAQFYTTANIRPINNDSDFSYSENWVNEHIAFTKFGSLVIGILRESSFANWKYYIDTCVLPEMFNIINKSITDNKQITYFYETDLLEEDYIKSILQMKYRDKINFGILDDTIIKKINETEIKQDIAIITTSTSCVFAMKYLIERR